MVLSHEGIMERIILFVTNITPVLRVLRNCKIDNFLNPKFLKRQTPP